MRNTALASTVACVLASVAFAGAAQGLPKTPSASPGCDAKNICRVYVTLEQGASGKDQVNVYPDALHTNSGTRDVHVVWIVLNDGVSFQSTASIAIQQGDPTQWTDKYTTDDDDGDRPGPAFRPKNFHGKFPRGAKAGTYKYSISVQRQGEAPVGKDPTIVNSH